MTDINISGQKNILTVDPGLGGTGWAFWDKLECAPNEYGVIRSPVTITKWEYKASTICREFDNILGLLPYRCRICYIEFPKSWSQSQKSHAATYKGDLLKLAFLIGRLVEILESKWDFEYVHLIEPHVWKGQLSKKQVNKRIRKELGESYPDHISDAVGMGLYLMGRL